MSTFLDENFSGLSPYVPGEQPCDREYIKLNTNESPFPPSPMVKAAITGGEIDALRLYSDPEALSLTAEIAAFFDVSPKQVFVAGGSDEVLGYAFMAYCQRGKKAVFPDITYGFYNVFSALFGAQATKIPLAEDWRVEPSDYFGAQGTVVIANPNAPTGLSMSMDELASICEHNPENVVLIDEAYADFAGETAVSILNSHPNLLVVQTYSKSRCLAGGRIGFAIASEEIIADLNLMKFSLNPYDLDRLSILAGIAAMRDRAYLEECVSKIIATRERTAAGLRALGFGVLDSKTNFLFVEPKVMGGAALYEKLKSKGILTRFFPGPRTDPFLRITIGSASDTEKLLAALKEIVA